jgi:hypothetical protein
MSSQYYFGVKHTAIRIFDDIPAAQFIEDSSITEEIPQFVIERSDIKNRVTWYNEKYPFQIGNEHLYLSFVDYVIRTEMLDAFTQRSFSYHFIPAYTRKATHYFMAELITKHFQYANVIIMNGNGMELYRRDQDSPRTHLVRKIVAGFLVVSDKKDKTKPRVLEPSKMIQSLIENYEECPTFVTGLQCVGMSVTLINQEIGNFDTVIMGHDQLNREQRYQLCRFVFNYERWRHKNIKQTQLFSLTKSVVETCLQYEQEVETICRDFQGTTVTIRQIQGLEPYQPSSRAIKRKVVLTLKEHLLNPVQWKRFVVTDSEQEEEMWEKARKFYQDIRGKELKGKSMPKKVGGFYNCSTTSSTKKGCQIRTEMEIDQIRLSGNYQWSSLFQLYHGQLSYARVFVGYKNELDSSEYTIYIKYAQLRDCPEVLSALEVYKKKQDTENGSETETESESGDSVSEDE